MRDETRVQMMVDLDGGEGAARYSEIERWQRAHPDRIAVFARLDYASRAADPEFLRLGSAPA